MELASPLVHGVMKQLSTLLMGEICKLWQVDEEVRKLQTTYLKLEPILDKLDCWQMNNSTLESLLEDLQRYCYDTEDLLDDLILSRPIKQEDEKQPFRYHIIRSGRFTIPDRVVKLQNKLEDITSQIDSIISAGEIKLKQHHAPVPDYKSQLWDKTPLAPGISREQDKKTIVLKLTSEQRNHSGVTIIGMDGLGKTTLARTILDDEKIRNHFPLILSACVSDYFRTEDIVQKLVADHSRRTRPHNHHQTTESNQNDLILHSLLHSHRSLIILDDLWGVADVDWYNFTWNYLNSSPGWKILITTRNPNVAEVTKSTSFHLNRMTDEDCKKLIIHKAQLSTFDSECWSSDIDVIAKNCKGMPVVACKLGLKLLLKERAVDRRNIIVKFKKNELWKLEEFREVFPSLNLNKPKLLPDLKRCFAYCSLFSPNHEFNGDDLIQLWEVDGFIQPQDTSKCFDD